MADDDYFEAALALNPTTNTLVPGAEALVYAVSDTAYSTPLAITDLQGVPLARLTASATGIYPAFRVEGSPERVVAKSGPLLTPMTSAIGRKGPKGDDGASLPDAAGLPDGHVLTVRDGAWVPGVVSGGSGTGGSAGVITRYESPLGSGQYPNRGTNERVRVDWVGVMQPTISNPSSGTNFETSPLAMNDVDFFHRVVLN